MYTIPVPAAPIDGEAVMPLAQAKLHLSVDGDEQDTLIAILRDAAIEWVEAWTSKALLRRAWTATSPGFGDRIVLQRQPVWVVSAISYLDSAGAEQSIAADGWRLSAGAAVLPNAGRRWPGTLVGDDVVTVTFEAGYEEGNCPPALVAAAMLVLAHLFKNREAVVVGTITSELPFGVVSLCKDFRRAGA
ncbi:MAG: phage head-tail connector protein [Sphingomonas bacterium]|nr:phage head-tail connector protein [Sphingomonas bacterium]